MLAFLHSHTGITIVCCFALAHSDSAKMKSLIYVSFRIPTEARKLVRGWESAFKGGKIEFIQAEKGEFGDKEWEGRVEKER